jgi:hypothetical protein
MIGTTRKKGPLETIKRRDGSTLTVYTPPDGSTFRLLSVPLLRRHGVHLTISGTCLSVLEDGHAKKITGRKCAPGQNFARHFHHVWERLPPEDQGLLVSYWRSRDVRVELSTYRLGNFRAICTDRGFTLRFRPYEDLLPGRLVYATIAHELAHAYRYAAGIHSDAYSLSEHPDKAESMKRFAVLSQPSRVLPRGYGYTVGDEEEEAAAEALVAKWGFRPRIRPTGRRRPKRAAMKPGERWGNGRKKGQCPKTTSLVREQILEMKGKGVRFTEIAKVLKLSRRTIHNVLKEEAANGTGETEAKAK